MENQFINTATTTNSIDEINELISLNTKNEMNEFKNLKNDQIKSHKDPLIESNKYLSKNDVYELFKVKITL